jgi:PmbA protein
MTPDPYREMPDPALYAGREEKDLGIHDPAITSQTTEQRKRYAAAAEAAGVQAGGERVIQAEATCEDSEAELYQVHSNGFEGSVRESGYDSYVEVSLQDEGDKRPSGDYDVSSRFGAQLVGPDVVGRKAAENGLVQLGAKKIETARLAMVVENRVASRLISSLLAAASGRALQQKQSFLEGQVGQTFAGALLDLADDPFVPGGWGSRLFDGEGITARRLPLFERGVFRNFYIDTYYGKKLGLPPTTGGRSNVVLTPGEKTPEQLVAGVRRGILVRGFLGGNSNSTTGDFSVGLHGTLIENGALTKAVSEMNIAGNHKEFWKSLAAVGNDPWPHSSMRIPTLLFGEVQFSGA